MKRFSVRIIIISTLAIGWSGSALADWKADVGYTQLQTELGDQIPTGAGVKVTQVEAGGDEGGGKPDSSNSQFSGKTFIEKTLSLTIDGHATTVGQLFYGNSNSMTPGITQIDCYASGNWRHAGLLNYGTGAPLISSSRVGNHSYVGSDAGYASIANTLARLDWVANRDEFIQATAMNNGGTNYPYMGSSFNAISVGLSSGGAAHGAYALVTTPETPYASASRTKPDLVVPQSATSWATPVAASAAALLVDAGHRAPSLSTDPVSQSTTNRNGDTIYNAERSETVKAALMAGASRTSSNLSSRYSINTTNGLNNILGAGELNILNSYHILFGGEQNSQEDKASTNGQISSYGFDYDPQFGGSSSSNRTGTYVFRAQSEGTLSASLVWNLNVAGGPDGSFDTTATLNNLGLYLYDTTTSSEVAHYTSTIDNTQNIWTNLTPDHDYKFEVKAETPENFNLDYALAWNSTANLTSPGPTPTYSNADINQDTKVDISDFNIFKSDFLKITANLTNPRSDINGDGQATIKDVGILMSGWR